MNTKVNWDALGITASVACAIHCALLPLFLTSLPILGIDIIENEAFEYFMIILAAFIGVFSLTHGLKKHHSHRTPVYMFLTGMSLLLAKQYWHQYHVLLLVPAVTLIVSAHYLNYRYCKKAEACGSGVCKH